MAKRAQTSPYKFPIKQPINPIRDVGEKSGVGKFISSYLPQNFFGNWSLRRYNTSLKQAEVMNNLVELDALYSWIFRTSALWNGLWNMRSTPFFAAVVDVYNGTEDDAEWNEEITTYFKNATWFQALRNEYCLSIATGVRAGAVFEYKPYDPYSGEWVSFPMRNLDWINKGLREGTYQYSSVKEADKNENLFWFQPNNTQEQRWGLLQSGAKAIIDYDNANREWQNSALLYASPRVKILYQSEGEKLKAQVNQMSEDLLLGGIPNLPSHPDPETGELIPDIDVRGFETGGMQDVFRVFSELKQQAAGDLSMLLLGSTMLGSSSRSAYSEWLVRVGHSKMMELVKKDIDGFFDWLNSKEVKTKLALISGYTELIDMEFRYETTTQIDAFYLKDYSEFMKNSGYVPTAEFMSRIGLSKDDYEKAPEEQIDNGNNNGANNGNPNAAQGTE